MKDHKTKVMKLLTMDEHQILETGLYLLLDDNENNPDIKKFLSEEDRLKERETIYNLLEWLKEF